MEALVREVGERGKIKTKPSTEMQEGVPPKAAANVPPAAFELTPEPATVLEAPAPALAPAPAPAPAPTPAPALALAPATPMTSNRTALAPAVLETQQQFSPSLQISPAVQQHTALVNAGTLSEMAAIFERQRDDAKAERDEAKAERAEMQAKAERAAEMQAKAERAEMQAKIEAQLKQQQVITKDQLAAVQTRLEVLHASELLSDDELGAVEDCLADFFEASAGCEHMTMETASMNRAVGTVLKLIALSEGMTKDRMFARQVKRKFC
jgi:hypothetical protein